MAKSMVSLGSQVYRTHVDIKYDEEIRREANETEEVSPDL